MEDQSYSPIPSSDPPSSPRTNWEAYPFDQETPSHSQGWDEDECDDGLTSQNLELRQQVMVLEAEVAYLTSKLTQQSTIMNQLQSTALLTHGVSHPPKPLVARTDDNNTQVDAIEAGDINLIRRMIDEAPDQKLFIAEMGNGLLLGACQRGHLEIVKYLLDVGANVHVDHDSPLQWASQRGDQDLAELLLERGANAQALNNCPLRLALHMGHKNIVRILMEHSPP